MIDPRYQQARISPLVWGGRLEDPSNGPAILASFLTCLTHSSWSQTQRYQYVSGPVEQTQTGR